MLQHVIPELLQKQVPAGAKRHLSLHGVTGMADQVIGAGAGITDVPEGQNFLRLLAKGIAALQGCEQGSQDGVGAAFRTGGSHGGPEEGLCRPQEPILASQVQSQAELSTATTGQREGETPALIAALPGQGETVPALLRNLERAAQRVMLGDKAVGSCSEQALIAAVVEAMYRAGWVPDAESVQQPMPVIGAAETLDDGLCRALSGAAPEKAVEAVPGPAAKSAGKETLPAVAEIRATATEPPAKTPGPAKDELHRVGDIRGAFQERLRHDWTEEGDKIRRETDPPRGAVSAALPRALKTVLAEQGVAEQQIAEIMSALQERIVAVRAEVRADAAGEADRPEGESRVDLTWSLADVLAEQGVEEQGMDAVAAVPQERLDGKRTEVRGEGRAEAFREADRPGRENRAVLLAVLPAVLAERGVAVQVIGEITAALQERDGEKTEVRAEYVGTFERQGIETRADMVREAQRPLADSRKELLASLVEVLVGQGVAAQEIGEIGAALQELIGGGQTEVRAEAVRETGPLADSRKELFSSLAEVLPGPGVTAQAVGEIEAALQELSGGWQAQVRAEAVRETGPLADSRKELFSSLAEVLPGPGVTAQAIGEIRAALQERAGGDQTHLQAPVVPETVRPRVHNGAELKASLATVLREKGFGAKTIDDILTALKRGDTSPTAGDVAGPIRHRDVVPPQERVSEPREAPEAKSQAMVWKAFQEAAVSRPTPAGEPKPVEPNPEATGDTAVKAAGKQIETARSRADSVPATAKNDSLPLADLTRIPEKRGLAEKMTGDILADGKVFSRDQQPGAAAPQVAPDAPAAQEIVAVPRTVPPALNGIPEPQQVRERASIPPVKQGAVIFAAPEPVTADGPDGVVAEHSGVSDFTEAGSDDSGPKASWADKGKIFQGEPAGRADVLLSVSAASPAETGDALPVEGSQLVQQIADHLSQEPQRGAGRIKITLSPENLGSLDMEVLVRDNKVQVVLTAERSDVRQALQGQAEQLRGSLQELGLQVNGIDFLVRGSLQGMTGEAGGGPFWGRENRNGGGLKRERSEERVSLSQAIVSFSERQNSVPVTAGISLYV
jgi:hypothetical protein